jgi:hypothetical protein
MGTDAARRFRRRDSATHLVFQLLITAERRWHRLHGHRLVAHTIETLTSHHTHERGGSPLDLFTQHLLLTPIAPAPTRTDSEYERCI